MTASLLVLLRLAESVSAQTVPAPDGLALTSRPQFAPPPNAVPACIAGATSHHVGGLWLKTLVLAGALSLMASCPFAAVTETAPRPNMLGITAADLSPNLGCFGDIHARTPRLDSP